MDQMLKDSIIARLQKQKGHVGFFYKNLVTGETLGFHEQEQFLAASVIKLPVFMCISKWAEEGKVSMSEKITVTEEDKVPVCGALTLFTGEVEADIRTLCSLMISLSDNTATNVLIRRFGIEAFQQEFLKTGLRGTELNRLLFDAEAGQRGLENKIVPSEMAMLLEQIYRRSFVTGQVSEDVEQTLFLQQINHKICGIIVEEDVAVAHKTGEDEHLSNDVGLVYAKQPFIVCFAGHDISVPDFEDLIRHISAELFAECMK